MYFIHNIVNKIHHIILKCILFVIYVLFYVINTRKMERIVTEYFWYICVLGSLA